MCQYISHPGEDEEGVKTIKPENPTSPAHSVVSKRTRVFYQRRKGVRKNSHTLLDLGAVKSSLIKDMSPLRHRPYVDINPEKQRRSSLQFYRYLMTRARLASSPPQGRMIQDGLPMSATDISSPQYGVARELGSRPLKISTAIGGRAISDAMRIRRNPDRQFKRKADSHAFKENLEKLQDPTNGDFPWNIKKEDSPVSLEIPMSSIYPT